MNSKVLIILLAAAIGGPAYAAGQPVPHIFQAGQKAVASEVNENFQTLADRIAGLPGGTVLDVADFAQAATITGKDFQISGGPCTNDHRTFTHPAADTRVETSTMSGGGSCSGAVVVTTVVTDSSGTRVTEIDSGANMQTFSPPLLILPTQVSAAVPWTGETIFTNTSPASSGVFVSQYLLIGLDDVTVPAGTFAGCLKTYRTSTSTGSPGRIDWRCPGMGLVKQMDPAIGMSELSAITP